MPHVLEARDGLCPSPFLQASDFPTTGGYIPGRFCAPLPSTSGDVVCCLPCPQTDWIYPDNFSRLTRVANYLNIVGMTCSIFLLASFIFLPITKTHRHYLSVSLTIGIILMQLAFIIPLGSKPQQCHNKITPNDMYSDVSCALSGACLLAGGWCGVMWVFLRALSLHLQICWEVVPGKKFFYGAQLAGWGIPAVSCAVGLTITGVSYRFGDTCHINHTDAIKDIWGPLLSFAGAAIVVQFATFGYCLQVYLRSLLDDGSSTQNSSNLPSYTNSVRTIRSARQAYRRVRKVLSLQWRAIFIVILIIADVVFFSIVFVSLDNDNQNARNNPEIAQPWLVCLVINSGDKNKCLNLAKDLVMSEATIMAVLILLSLNGIWLLVLLGRWSMVTSWFVLLESKFRARNEFVSLDAERPTLGPKSYEMFSSPRSGLKSPDPLIVASPSPGAIVSPDRKGSATDYFGRDAKYSSSHLSYSSPIAPNRPGGRESDSTGSSSQDPKAEEQYSRNMI